MAEAAGTRYGHYRVIEPVGTGGFATVYRALDERLDAEVAIKVLAENHALDPDIRERFITEGQLLRRVAGDAIIAIHDVGETDRGQPFLVMDHADRGDLRTRLVHRRASGASLNDVDVQPVADTLVQALGAMHEVGLVHRDVTPDNLFISSRGGPPHAGRLLDDGERLQLGDLGYAKDLIASSGLTVGGGTQGFNAPEQQVGMGIVDARADIYGVSAVIYWCLTGQSPPRNADERAEGLAAANLSATMRAVLSTGLAEDREHRFETVADWSAAFDGPARTSAPVTAGPGWSAPASRASHRTRAAMAAAAVAVGIGVGAVGMAALGNDGDSPRQSVMDDGRTRVQDDEGGLQVAVFGAPRASVGDTMEFEAAIKGAESYRWLTPDGTVVENQPRLVLEAPEAGNGTVTLIGRDPDGKTLAVDFAFTVQE